MNATFAMSYPFHECRERGLAERKAGEKPSRAGRRIVGLEENSAESAKSGRENFSGSEYDK
jgi:hypothetical protein